MSILYGLASGIRQGTYGGQTVGLTNSPVLYEVGPFTLTDVVVTNFDATHGAYVNFYDAATVGAVIVGTTVPVLQLYAAPGQTTMSIPSPAIAFVNGIATAAATTANGNVIPFTPVAVGYAIL